MSAQIQWPLIRLQPSNDAQTLIISTTFWLLGILKRHTLLLEQDFTYTHDLVAQFRSFINPQHRIILGEVVLE